MGTNKTSTKSSRMNKGALKAATQRNGKEKEKDSNPVYGFAFRSPDVIRLSLDRGLFAAFVVAENDLNIDVRKAILSFQTQPVGSRRRVYLYKSLKAFRQHNKLISTATGIHVIHDAHSALREKNITILDIDTKDKQNWQVAKTLGSVLNKLFASMKDGLDPKVVDALCVVQGQQEDQIITDRVTSEQDRHKKSKGYLITVQDFQSKNANVRSQIASLIARWWMGEFFCPENPKQKEATTKFYDKPLSLICFSKKNEPNVIDDSLTTLLREFEKLGVKLHGKGRERIRALLGTPEHILCLRAMLLVKQGVPYDKACAEVGAPPSLVAVVSRNITNKDKLVVTKNIGNDVLMLGKRHEEKRNAQQRKQDNEDKLLEEYNKNEPNAELVSVVKKKRNKIVGLKIKEGKWKIEQILVKTKLAVPKYIEGTDKLDPFAILLQSPTPASVKNARVFKEKGVIKYLLEREKTYYVRFKGKKHKLKIVPRKEP